MRRVIVVNILYSTFCLFFSFFRPVSRDTAVPLRLPVPYRYVTGIGTGIGTGIDIADLSRDRKIRK